jgi:hypothetical protein
VPGFTTAVARDAAVRIAGNNHEVDIAAANGELTFIGCKSLEKRILAFASSVPGDDIITGTLTET